MQTGLVLLISGAGLMILGVVMVVGCISGGVTWFGQGASGRDGNPKVSRLLLGVTFIALVPAPLLSGALMILYGLYCLQ